MITGLRRLGGHPAIDFVNTVDPRGEKTAIDYLLSYDALLGWSVSSGLIESNVEKRLREESRARVRSTDAALRRAIAARELLYRIFVAVARDRKPQPDDLAEVGRLVTKARMLQVFIVEGDGYRWDWDVVTLDLPALAVINAAVALFEDSTQLRERLHECAGDPCGWFFIDKSKNGTRRWCSMEGCGNRAKARRFSSS